MDLKTTAAKALSLMDLTSLTDQESFADIGLLCAQATTEFGNVAAICIFPRFIPYAKQYFKQNNVDNVKIATVTNFPHGQSNIDIAVAETKAAVAYGADEVDLVFPYKALINGDENIGAEMVKACKAACGDTIKLKVIIESGELKTPELIALASKISIEAGADFIKTSTGKVPVNATPESAQIMLNTIKSVNPSVGFKAAGGVRTAEDSAIYLDMAAEILGGDWVNSDKFRFGASGLLTNLVNTLSDKDNVSTEGY